MKWRTWIIAAVELAGLACVVYGISLVHAPSAAIVGGVALVALAQGWRSRS